jgi:hypothetical protein
MRHAVALDLADLAPSGKNKKSTNEKEFPIRQDSNISVLPDVLP